MQKYIFYPQFCFVVALFLMIGCKKESSFEPDTTRFIPIMELRNMYKGSPLTISSNESGVSIFITGVVISDGAQGNSPNGKIVIQNYVDGALRGIALSVSGQSTRYLVGDSVVVNAEGARLERVDGLLQLSGLSVNEVGEYRLHTHSF